MSTLNYIDKNGNVNKAGVIPKNYPASNIKMANGDSVEDTLKKIDIELSGNANCTFTNKECYRRNGLTKISARGTLASPLSSGTITVGSIPVAYAPTNDIVAYFLFSGTNIGVLWLDTTGEIKVRYMQGTNPFNDFSFNLVY